MYGRKKGDREMGRARDGGRPKVSKGVGKTNGERGREKREGGREGERER